MRTSSSVEQWRFFAGVFAGEFFGAALAVLAGQPHGIWILDLVIGGAMGIMPGAAAGLLWHRADPVRRASTNWLGVILTFMVGALLLLGVTNMLTDEFAAEFAAGVSR
jgi:hypothetical protein